MILANFGISAKSNSVTPIRRSSPSRSFIKYYKNALPDFRHACTPKKDLKNSKDPPTISLVNGLHEELCSNRRRKCP
ncbi:unnamed protein product [Parnassius apollo]|uniref:(apollo) hypothetical protein n=1 Tax=Parnassius apollo TaxID=110799 RepID=A0A8S3XXB3_PARAO|nr:unnamed protein product [Parnassius apollo]